jgi:hypothetical protein
MPVSSGALLQEFPIRSIDAIGYRYAKPTNAFFPGVNRDLSPGFADVDASSQAAVIISDATTGIYAYSTKGKLVAKIISGLSGPEGMTGTKTGSFYVANTTSSNVLLYKNDYKTVLATLTDPYEYPVDVSYEETTGMVGVANSTSTSDGAGTVSFYARGKTRPCVTVGNSAWGRVYFDAFDSKGNLFVNGLSTSGSTLVGEVTGGCKAKTITTLKLGTPIAFPGAVQITKNDDIAILNSVYSTISTYKPPVNGSLGPPITTPLNGMTFPASFAFTSTGKRLWTADMASVVADDYTYPVGGVPIFGFSGSPSEPAGIVVTPLDAP